MEEEFKTLSEKRKELMEIMLKERPTAGRIYRIIKKQDKEFIKINNKDGEREVGKLKKVIVPEKEDNMFILGRIQGVLWMLHNMQKRAGKELI